MLDSIAENDAVFLAYEWFVHYYPITPFFIDYDIYFENILSSNLMIISGLGVEFS